MRYFNWLTIFLFLTFNLAFGQVEQPFIYNDGGRHDPFLHLVDDNGRFMLDTEIPYSSSELNLSGILWDPRGESSALLNNELVKVGESISGFLIEKITRDSVTASKNGRECILRLSIEKEE